MNVINKQKFLAELGRLLTFMYEEDRQTALSMYNKMFESVEDEQLLLQFLVSPTRQAVVLARAYDAKERKLQVHAQSRNDDGGYADDETPDFVLAIDQLQRDALSHGVAIYDAAPAVEEDADQISLFDDGVADADAEYAPDDYSQSPMQYTPPVPAPAAKPVQKSVSSAPVYAEPAAVQSDVVEPADDADDDPDAFVPPEKNGKGVDEFADAVDAFLADFSLEGGELIPAPAKSAPAVPASNPAPPAPTAPEPVKAPPADFDEDEHEPKRKPKVFLLILYIILATPITLIGILLLLVPTLFFLALAIGVISLGVFGFSSAFSGFAVLADILAVLGVALIVLALGLLFAWLFVWFIGGAIVGLIRAVCYLGRKWCYKEVADR